MGGHLWKTTMNFLFQNGFTTVNACSGAVLTSLCYAAFSGETSLIQALLAMKSDLNHKFSEAALRLSPGSEVIDICAVLHHNDALAFLLKEHCADGRTPEQSK